MSRKALLNLITNVFSFFFKLRWEARTVHVRDRHPKDHRGGRGWMGDGGCCRLRPGEGEGLKGGTVFSAPLSLGFHGCLFCDPGWLAAKDGGREGGDGGVSGPSIRICTSAVSSSENLFFSAQICSEKRGKKKSTASQSWSRLFLSERKQPSRREPGAPSPSPGSPHQVCCALNNSYFLRN